MEEEQTALIEEWPKVSFNTLAKEEVEGGVARVFYTSFMTLLRLPETMVTSFVTLFREKPQ